MFDHYHKRSTMVMLVIMALFLGMAIGMGIAVFIAMRTLQMDFIYPATIGWGWA